MGVLCRSKPPPSAEQLESERRPVSSSEQAPRVPTANMKGGRVKSLLKMENQQVSLKEIFMRKLCKDTEQDEGTLKGSEAPRNERL